VAAWLAQQTGTWSGAVMLFVAVTGVGLWSLLRTPPPFVDEAWYASRAWSFIQTGRAFGTLDAGVFDKYEGYWTYFPLLGTWLQALAIRMLGLSLLSVRLVSLTFGLALLAAIYAIGKQLFGPRVGLLAVFLMAFSPPFLYSSHLARQDIMVAALGFSALALSVTNRTSSVKGLLAGLAVGLAFEIHPNGALYGPPIVGLYLLDGGWSALRAKRFWAFVAGLAGGLAFYAAIHILPYPGTYAALTGLAFSSTHTPPLLVPNRGVWLESVLQTCQLFGSTDIRLPLVVAAVVVLLRRRSAADRKLLTLSTALILAFTALVRNKLGYYALLVSPSLDLLVAALVWELLQGCNSSSRWARRSTAVALGLVTASVAMSVTPMLKDPTSEYGATLDRVRQAIAPESSVLGTQTYWFAMPDKTYFSWQQLVYYQRSAPGSSLEDAFRALHPDVLIIDPHIEWFVAGDKSQLPNYRQFLTLPKAELERFLDRQAELVTTVETPTFGRIRIYRIDWSLGPD
jgi:4-amino-4-deoxy-L-arabinose transferase-like glycosyltransferase